MVRVMGMRQVGKMLAPRLYPLAEQETLRRKIVRRWSRNDKKAYVQALYALKDWSVMDRLGEVRCPVLVIAADQDYSPLSHKIEYTRRMLGAQLTVVKDARHALPLEKAAAFNNVLTAFLPRHSST